jgi:hypothetical protein
MDKGLETCRKRHENMGKDMETWTRTWQHGGGHGNMDEDMYCRHGNMEI